MKFNLPAKILLVDDDASFLASMSEILLAKGYFVYQARSRETALNVFKSEQIDIVLLDMVLSESSGLEVLKDFKKISPSLPVILISGFSDIKAVQQGLNLGAANFLLKPIDDFHNFENIVADEICKFQNLKTHLMYQNKIELTVHEKTEELKTRNAELLQANHKLETLFIESITSMANIMEKRDSYTAGHQHKVAKMCKIIAEKMSLNTFQMESVYLAALVHDIGKIGVPLEILIKPTKLSNYEFEIIKMHPVTGFEILSNIHTPWPLATIVRQHHEKIDGSGYPDGLSGDAILLESKILAIADVWDAMSSHRPYRAALGTSAALSELMQHKSIYYDPYVVEICEQLVSEQHPVFMYQ